MDISPRGADDETSPTVELDDSPLSGNERVSVAPIPADFVAMNPSKLDSHAETYSAV